MAIGRFVLRLSVIKNISALFKDAAGTVEAASAGKCEILPSRSMP